MAVKEFYSNGKILLTSEYLVLKGAKALAQPLKLGQSLKIVEGRGSEIKWKSLDANGKEWFTANFSLWDFKAEKTSDPELANKLTELFKKAVRLNSEFLSTWVGIKAESKLMFDKNWGLGSSSTLIDLIAQWSDVDPFELLGDSFGGSGYDIACAQAKKPILYRIDNDFADYEEIDWNPSYKNNLYLAYTGVKQLSSKEVDRFFADGKFKSKDVDEANDLTEAFLKAKNTKELNKIIDSHEKFIGSLIDMCPVKNEKFSDFDGAIKSLGAWGGDFLLVSTEQEKSMVADYFNNKGIDVLFSWDEICMS